MWHRSSPGQSVRLPLTTTNRIHRKSIRWKTHLLHVLLKPPLFLVSRLGIRQTSSTFRSVISVHHVIDTRIDNVESGVRTGGQRTFEMARQASQHAPSQPLSRRLTHRTDAGSLGKNAPRQRSFALRTGFGWQDAVTRQQVAYSVQVATCIRSRIVFTRHWRHQEHSVTLFGWDGVGSFRKLRTWRRWNPPFLHI